MHAIADLENRGLPAVFVASTEFVTAAAAQSVALGFPAASVFVAHPIQDRSDEELRALADTAFEEILARITKIRIAPGGDVQMANGVILAPETLPIEFDLR